MAIQGYTSIKQDPKAFAEAMNQTARRSGESMSPYQEGMKFKLADDPIDVVRNAEGNVYTIIWLEREDKTKAELWLSTLEKHDNEGARRVVSEATINVAFKQAVNGKEVTNKELAEAFINIVGDKEFKVVRTYYSRTVGTRYGQRTFSASLVGFEFVD